ncbi:MAG: glycerol acyltransferase, partial [Proteobacteria bacterium]|nr:glycerol acyltransferase [Pseudomonadota bacterium]
GLPILIKQYTKLAAKAVAWNVDPAFDNTLDCLMAADLLEADRKYMSRYLGPEGEAAYHHTHLGEELPALSRCA